MFEIYDDFLGKWEGSYFTTYEAAEDYVENYLAPQYTKVLIAQGLDIWSRFVIYQRWS